ncbi:MAG TPA: response regulator [Blastocatellia bacterium]|nr:response regulator [Blastocatellia bacterium]
MKSAVIEVLCVEADIASCKLMMQFLDGQGLRTIATNNIRDGLRLVECMGCGLFIVGGQYRDGTGLELCRRIRSIDQQTPIVFYSEQEGEREEAKRTGAQISLTGPGEIIESYPAILGLLDQL